MHLPRASDPLGRGATPTGRFLDLADDGRPRGVDPSRDRSGLGRRARVAWRPTSLLRSTPCEWPPTTPMPCGPGPCEIADRDEQAQTTADLRACSAGCSQPTTSSSSAVATTGSTATCCGRSPAPASVCCATDAARFGQSPRRAVARREGEVPRRRPPRRHEGQLARPVHRPDYFAYVSVKRFGPGGEVVGERRFLGLWRVRRLPVAARPTSRCCGARCRPCRAAPASTARQPRRTRAPDILETFHARRTVPDRHRRAVTIAIGIPNLQERRQVRLFARRDDYGRFVSCLIYVPRDRYSSPIVERMEEILLDAYGGQSAEYDSSITASVLARLHVLVFVGPDAPTDIDERREVERRLAAVTRWWADDLRDCLVATAHGEEAGLATFAAVAHGFPASYREAFAPAAAVTDLQRMDALGDDGTATALYDRAADGGPGAAPEAVLPRRACRSRRCCRSLEQMGVAGHRRAPVRVHARPDARASGCTTSGCAPPGRRDAVRSRVRDEFLATFGAVWRGEVENDGFNRLVLVAGLTARPGHGAAGLRQVPAPDRPHLQPGLRRGHAGRPPGHRAPAGRAVHGAVRPAPRRQPGPGVRRHRRRDRRRRSTRWPASTRTASCARFLALVEATMRTNAYRPTTDGRAPSVLAFKLDPPSVPDLPPPAAAVRDLGVLARASRACTCAAAAWRAAASAGATAGRTSAPRSSGS